MGKSGTEGVSVGGTGVLVGVLVGVGVLVAVAVGKLVAVDVGVAVGGGANVLQDANASIRIESSMALLKVFIFPHFCFDDLVFIRPHVRNSR